MSGKKIVTVFGATGSQGGSVARFLLKDGTFAVRAVTRKVDSPPAQELAKLGAEIVQADLNDKASVVKSLTGAYGAFGVTNFWDQAVLYDGEIRQGKLLGDAVKETGVQHYVWSTLEHSNVPHCESKALVSDYLTEIGVPVTHLKTSFYYENFFNSPYTGISKDDNGGYKFGFPIPPDAEIPSFSVAETGGWVLSILKNPQEYIGKLVSAVSETVTMNYFVAGLEKVTGKKASTLQITREGLVEWGKGGWFQHELSLNNLFFVDNKGVRDQAQSDKVFTPKKWEQVLRDNLHRLPQ